MQISKVWLLVLVAVFASAAALAAHKPMTPRHPDFGSMGADRHRYISTAMGESDHLAPHCWRIGVPLVARSISATGVPLWVAFLGISFASLVAAGILVGLVTRSWLAVVALYTLPQCAAMMKEFWIPDATMLALISAGLLCIVKKLDALFLVVFGWKNFLNDMVHVHRAITGFLFFQ